METNNLSLVELATKYNKLARLYGLEGRVLVPDDRTLLFGLSEEIEEGVFQCILSEDSKTTREMLEGYIKVLIVECRKKGWLLDNEFC